MDFSFESLSLTEKNVISLGVTFLLNLTAMRDSLAEMLREAV